MTLHCQIPTSIEQKQSTPSSSGSPLLAERQSVWYTFSTFSSILKQRQNENINRKALFISHQVAELSTIYIKSPKSGVNNLPVV